MLARAAGLFHNHPLHMRPTLFVLVTTISLWAGEDTARGQEQARGDRCCEASVLPGKGCLKSLVFGQVTGLNVSNNSWSLGSDSFNGVLLSDCTTDRFEPARFLLKSMLTWLRPSIATYSE